MTYLAYLECTRCGEPFPADRLQTVCALCGKPLYARYDLERAARATSRADLERRPLTMWRYEELLPVSPEHAVTLGETMTPLLPVPRLAQDLSLERLWIKDESRLPTGSFKARGMAVAVSMARQLGVRAAAVPSAGNAAGALAAYGARAGIEVHVFMPADAPLANREECLTAGAEVVLVDGLISDAGRLAAQAAAKHGWFDFSTLKEPYRVEGKKTMGAELVEQLGWEVPDAILYPTGGGTGLVAMWKVFQEMEALGWIDSRRPRLYAVQAEGCAPIVEAFRAGAQESRPWPEARTIAAGIRVPKALGDFLILRALRESGGSAVAVADEEIRASIAHVARREGLLLCPEGAATVAALRRLLEDGSIKPDERVVLFNTASGYKYPGMLALPATDTA